MLLRLRSVDQTVIRAERVGVQVINHLINRGAGAATQTAIEWARQSNISFMVLLDADGLHTPKDIGLLTQRMTKGDCDIVIGSRFLSDNSQMPLSRKWFNSLANLLTNLFCSNRYTDSQSGLRMLNRQAIEQLNLTIDHFGFCSEMLILAEQKGLIVKEVPITTLYTDYSRSKGQNFLTGLGTAFQILWKIIFK